MATVGVEGFITPQCCMTVLLSLALVNFLITYFSGTWTIDQYCLVH